jgi:hypothetical protein
VVLLGGCSEAERSATTPAPNLTYVAAAGGAEGQAQADRVCEYYHSQPAAPAEPNGPLARFECKGRARGGESFFVERMGL